jgi:hypothetical protein
MRQHVERARLESARQAVAAELATARAAWDAELQDRLAQATAAASANLEESRAAWQAEAEDRLAKMAAQAETRIKEAEARSRQQSQEALAQAAEAWRGEEAARLAAAEAQWREQSTRFLAAAEARAGRAETALKEARAQAEATRERGGEELRRLREELAAVTAALSTREAELADMRKQVEQAHTETARQAVAAELAAARAAWNAGLRERMAALKTAEGIRDVKRTERLAAARAESQRRIARYTFRGLALAASLAAAVVLDPRTRPAILEGWWLRLVSSPSKIEGPPHKAGLPAHTLRTTSTQIPERFAVIRASVANIRSDPSISAPVTTTLLRNTKVALIGQRGDWVQIRFGGKNGQGTQEGWVYRSLLNDPGPTAEASGEKAGECLAQEPLQVHDSCAPPKSPTTALQK